MTVNDDEVKKVVIEFTGDQIAELGILCDAALKASGMRVLKIAAHIQNETVRQVKEAKPVNKNGAAKAR